MMESATPILVKRGICKPVGKNWILIHFRRGGKRVEEYRCIKANNIINEPNIKKNNSDEKEH